MKLIRNNSVDLIIAERIRQSLLFSSKDKEVIKRTEDIINKEEPNKLLRNEPQIWN